MSEERLQILKMIEDGKISAEEGIKLLNAVEETNEVMPKKEIGKAKWLKVRVYDTNGKAKVNVNVPISLIHIGLKIGTKFHSDLEEQLKEIDLEEIIEAVKKGAEGKLVEVEDENGDKIEVFVE